MKQVKNKLRIVLLMALGIIVFSNVLLAHAALPDWYFKTKSGITIKRNKTINMKKNEFQDFNLYKDGKEIKQNDAKLHLSWSSDNEDVIWVDASNGKARADKFGTMKGDYGEATVTAKIKNRVTNAVTYRKFKVVVGAENKPEPTATPMPSPKVASIALQIKGKIDTAKPLETHCTYQLETIVYDENKNQISSVSQALFFKYFSNKDGILITGDEFTPTQEGEYTITVGAFLSEADATSATSVENAAFAAQLQNLQVQAGPPRILKARQMTLDTVKLTLNTADYAKALVDDNSLLHIECNTGLYTYLPPFNTVTLDEDDPCSVLIQMWEDLEEPYQYTYSYDGIDTASATIIGSNTTPAAIRLVGGPVESQQFYQLEVKVYNNRGVDISDADNYFFQFSERDMNWMDSSYSLSGDQIWFYAEGKSATVEATLDRGYDDNGYPIPALTSIAHFYSVPKAEAVYQRSQMFALTDQDHLSVPNKLDYSSEAQTICVGDDDLFVVAAFSYRDDEKTDSLQYIASGIDTTGNGYTYTYKSADPATLIVGETKGDLLPIKDGTTAIYIIQHKEYLIDDSKGTIVATVPITVAPERALSSFSLSEQSAVRLSTTGNTNGDEYISIKLNALDQQGDPVDATYSFSVADPVGAVFGSLFKYEIENNILKIWEGPGLNNFVSKEIPKNIIVTVTANYNNVQKKQNFQMTIRNTKDANIFASELFLTNSRIDLNLNRTDLNSFTSTVQIRSVDNGGSFVRLENLKYVTSETSASTEKDVYSIAITNSVDDTPATNLYVETSEKEIKIHLLNITDNAIKKAERGIYKITLYRGNGSDAIPKVVKMLEVVDSSQSISLKQNKFSLLFADAPSVIDAVSISRGSTDITNYVSIQDMKCKQVDNTLVVYELYVKICTQEQNKAWNEEYYTLETIVPKTPLRFAVSY